LTETEREMARIGSDGRSATAIADASD
jgi:DNA-binding CsgD family transcriptional regulator